MEESEFGRYDRSKIEQAEKLLEEVYEFNFGDPQMKKKVARLATILHKLEELKK